MIRTTSTVICTALVLSAVAAAGEPAQRGRTAQQMATAPPRVFLVDAGRLAETKRRVAAGDERLAGAMARLREEADAALEAGPFSVMQKEHLPPSGDKHDYMSVGPYWWPDPDAPDGKPYIRRDGRVNPERYEYDSAPLKAMCEAVETLALAYHLTDRQPYAEHAARLLRTWFLDPDTRMNPHLRFGQAIPGRCTGRGIGIIDTTRLVRLVDAVGMLDGSPAWTDADRRGLEKWFAAYLDWMLQSDYGRAEARTRNNHGTWYDVQVASFALFTGRRELARKVLQEAAARRIASQIEPDGRQPLELARTRSFDYSVMNLQGMFALAILGRCVDVDLWHFRTSDGRSIRQALDWLIPFAVGEKKWTHQQIHPLQPEKLFPLLRMAAIAYGEPRYEAVIAKLKGTDLASDRSHLLYPPPDK